MADSDWDTVTILRKKPEKASQMKTEQVNADTDNCFEIFSQIVTFLNFAWVSCQMV